MYQSWKYLHKEFLNHNLWISEYPSDPLIIKYILQTSIIAMNIAKIEPPDKHINIKQLVAMKREKRDVPIPGTW